MRVALLVLLAGATGFGIALAVAHGRRAPRTRTVVRVETRVRTPPAARAAAMPRVVFAFAPDPPPLRMLSPADAGVEGAWPIAAAAGIPPEIAVTWSRGSEDELDRERGFALWQRARAGEWRLVYARRADAVGERVETGDVTGDGHRDVLLFVDHDGSGGCGAYRLLATVAGRLRELRVRWGCADATRLELRDGALVAYDGAVKDPRSRGIHCCFTVWRSTERRWHGAEPLPPVVGWTRRRPAGFPGYEARHG